MLGSKLCISRVPSSWDPNFSYLGSGNFKTHMYVGFICCVQYHEQISQRVKCQFCIIKLVKINCPILALNMMCPRFVPQKTHALCSPPSLAGNYPLSTMTKNKGRFCFYETEHKHCHCFLLRLRYHDKSKKYIQYSSHIKYCKLFSPQNMLTLIWSHAAGYWWIIIEII